ncbi:MAG: uracil-DNA glycosylase family protein [Alphaproteobacteria bacterium]|nr:uracil-DNA glycosylase family protein [Alphaproteobacteria bacterium]
MAKVQELRKTAGGEGLSGLLVEVRSCRLCAADLPLGPRPVLRASGSARVLIAGQAPGTKVHESGIPWNDASGRRLRQWLGLSDATFYDDSKVAVMPQAFCYPGKGANGDLPPPPLCQKTWHGRLLAAMPKLEVIVVAGQYAQAYHLSKNRKGTLTETVAAWRDYQPRYFPVPHPSWHNNHWLKKNPWFERDLLPELRNSVHRVLGLK